MELLPDIAAVEGSMLIRIMIKKSLKENKMSPTTPHFYQRWIRPIVTWMLAKIILFFTKINFCMKPQQVKFVTKLT